MNDTVIHTTAIICQKMEVDSETNLMTLKNIIPALHVTLAPHEKETVGKRTLGIKTPLQVVLILDRSLQAEPETKKFDYTVEFLDSRGEVTMDGVRLEFEIEKSVQRYYAIFSFSRGVVTSLPGTHLFRVVDNQRSSDSGIIGQYPFEIFMTNQDGSLIDFNQFI